MKNTAPADVFVELWSLVASALTTPSHADRAPYLIRYDNLSAPELAFRGIEQALHQRQDWGCLIILGRTGPLPANVNAPDMSDDPDRDCIRLAHEYGHHISHAEDGADTNIPPEEMALVYREECAAWALGRKTLAGLGVTDWTRFDDEMSRCLATYRLL